MNKEEEIKFKKKIKEETMSRKDELIDAAKRNAAIVSEFLIGANWADQNPREGLWDAEKVCNFIEENIDNYLYINRDWNAPQIKSNFIEDLKKAMED